VAAHGAVKHHSRAILVREQHLPGFYPLTLANCQGRSKAVTIGTKQSHCRRKANSARDLLRWLARDGDFQSPPNGRDRLIEAVTGVFLAHFAVQSIRLQPPEPALE
jgi:hypothetical protein